MQALKIQGRMRRPVVWRNAAFVFAVFGLVILELSEAIEPDDWDMLGVMCLAPLAYALIIVISCFRDGAARVLTDPLIVLVTTFAFYFLLGTLMLVYGSDIDIAYVLSWYPATAMDSARVTGMNLIGLAITLFVAGYFDKLSIEKKIEPAIALFNKIPVRKIFWIFTDIGLGSILMVATENGIVSGTLRQITSLALIAILVGIIYRGRGASVLHIIAVIMTLLLSMMGLLTFGKLETLKPWVILFFGLYLRSPSIKLITIIFIFLSFFLIIIAQPISAAREMLAESDETSYSVRFDILENVFSDSFNGVESDDDSSIWTRLCYTTPQVAAVDLYDIGQGGNDMELLLWVFVPRALFPDKPIMTRSGVEFNEKVTGSTSSSTGIGLFISGYYNLGWFGLAIASILAGIILSVYSAVSRCIVSSGSVALLPVCLFGSFTAFRIDGHFVADYLGSFAMTMLPLLTLLFLLRFGLSNSGLGKVR